MQRVRAGSRRCASISSDILDGVFCSKQLIKDGPHVFPCPHIAVLFLDPEDSIIGIIFLQDLSSLALFGKRIELLDAHKRDIGNFPFFPLLNKIVVDFSAAKKELARILN